MKRIGLLLVLILSLGLLGCDPGSGYGKYAELYLLLEAGDYEGAHKVIDKLAGITATTAPTTTVLPATAAPTAPTTTVPPTTAEPAVQTTTVPPATAEPTVPTTTATPTTTPDAGDGFSLLEFPYTIGRNKTATVTIQAVPNTEYSIKVYYSSGPSKAAGLENKVSDGSGIVSWSWKIGGKTVPGTYRIEISGGGRSREYYFTIEAV